METNELKGYIFELVYLMAMRDALLQKAFEGSKKEIMEDKDNGVREELKKHVDDILAGNYTKKGQVAYDNDFYNLSDKICNNINNSNFTFGNAQKLINMTVKYFYILAYKKKDMNSKFKYCHCPMNQIIKRKAIAEYRDKGYKEYLVFECFGKKTHAWSSVAWSDIKNAEPGEEIKYGIDVYKNFQNIVRTLSRDDTIIPIEYDYKNYNKNEENKDTLHS